MIINIFFTYNRYPPCGTEEMINLINVEGGLTKGSNE